MDAAAHLKKAKFLATLLDSRWSILGVQFGIDPLFDIIPGITPLISVGLSLYILYIAKLYNLPGDLMLQMIGNIVLDYLIGSIPVLGFLGDIFFKSNLKNLTLLENYLNVPQEGTVIK